MIDPYDLAWRSAVRAQAMERALRDVHAALSGTGAVIPMAVGQESVIDFIDSVLHADSANASPEDGREKCIYCGILTDSPCDEPPPVMCSTHSEHLLGEQSKRAER